MRRCPAALVLVVTAAVSAAVLAPTASPAATPRHRAARSYDGVRNILPPGSDGNVDAARLLSIPVDKAADPTSLIGGLTDPKGLLTTATGTAPTNYADQLEQYDALATVDPTSLTDARLPDYYKDASLGVDPEDVVRTENPRPGTTIQWDEDGVPHITGATDADLAYGAGVAVMESRMFLTDVLRHTGAATMAQFVGPTDSDVAQDAAQLAIAPYTPAQLDKQITSLVHRSPAAARLVSSIDAYVDGINAEQQDLCPATTASIPLPGNLGLGFGINCPVEYAALQRPPQPYTRADVVSIASLVGGIFGTGGGGQDTNALWLQQLQEKFGKKAGRERYEDLREKNDPEAPVTATTRFPYGGSDHVRPGLPGVAMPDLHPKAEQLGTGAIVGADGTLSAPPSGAPGDAGDPGNDAPQADAVDPALEAQQIQGSLERAMSGELVGMSNAILVDGKHSAGGHPTAVFGPQTGYYAPQLLMEEDLHGPHTRARGVSFAGTNFVVEIGRGVDYAWSATSPNTDITDTVVQHLCNVDGSEPTVDSTAYVGEGGRCRPMVNYRHTETGLPTLAAAASPKQISFLVLRTDHGVVQRRTTLDGRPVAIVIERSTYMHEPDSVLGFVELDDPAKVRDADSFMRAASDIQYTFNWYYADDRDIAYYSSARLPKRAPGTDLDLPRWGTRKYDWKGFEPFGRHPHQIDPPQGYFANWNNKLAPGFASASPVWGDGAVYRSLTLSDRVRRLVAGKRPVERSDLVGAMIDAATVDVRGAYVLPWVLKVLGRPSDPQDAQAVSLLRSWVAAGAHRVDRDRTGHYDHQAAIDLFDTWWDPDGAGASCAPDCSFTLPRDALRHGLRSAVDDLPKPLDDHPREHIGSAFNGIAWYGYLNKDLRSLLGKRVHGAYSRHYCGTTLAGCRATLRSSLHRAVQAALADQQVDSVADLTYDKSLDDVEAVAGGVVGVRPIDWENRPTFQQVVQFSGHRPR